MGQERSEELGDGIKEEVTPGTLAQCDGIGRSYIYFTLTSHCRGEYNIHYICANIELAIVGERDEFRFYHSGTFSADLMVLQ